MKLRVTLCLLAVFVAAAFFSCRRNQPSLIDANRPPDTELWYAPLDSTEYEWDVHMYWRGVDYDGVVVGYIWTITDTLEADPLLRWNPSERAIDLQAGTITTRTDEVVAFTAYTNVEGVGLKKNRQAFHIAAIDDNGVIDPTPAVVEFIATVGRLPTMRFHTTITTWDPLTKTFVKKTSLYNPYAPSDTVGMFRPFSISYRGFTTNGVVTQYNYSAVTAGIVVDRQNQWCSSTDPCSSGDPEVNRANPCCPGPDWGSRCDDPEDPGCCENPHDCPDTLRYFPNRVEPDNPDLVNNFALASGPFRFKAQCRDVSGAESAVDTDKGTEGVVVVIVNYEPNTEINSVENLVYLREGEGPTYTELIDFTDDYPDTVPYDSWVRIDYTGWDNPRDSSLCKENPPLGREQDQCLGYQFQVERYRAASWSSSWYPLTSVHNSQPAVADSNSKNIGTWNYTLRVRAVDEYGTADGTMFDPLDGRAMSEVKIVGNFEPTLDTATISNYDGTVASEDTTVFVWDWWRPANYPDTLDFVVEEQKYYVRKIFYLDLNATGHDNPKENERFGVVNWRYYATREGSADPEPFFLGQGSWRESTPNVFNQRFEVQYRYPQEDVGGESSYWKYPPDLWNNLYEFSIQGRDIAERAQFEDYVYLHDVSSPPNPQGRGVKTLLNVSPASQSAQKTELRTFWFYLKMER